VRSDAWSAAREVLKQWPSQCYQADQAEHLQLQLDELEQRFFEQKEAESLLTQFCKRFGRQLNYDELDEFKQELEVQLDQNAELANESSEKRIEFRQELEQIQTQIGAYRQKAPYG